ncbi:hypothetical protein [Variovorax gracilis]|uniref:hypothetical protein n=1 Tax=Variovorax gracilis TaxID=3053502 RepID=UPI00336BDAD4
MKLFKAIGDHDGTGQVDEIAEFGKQLVEVQERLQRRPFFTALPPGDRNRYLNGSKAHLHSLEDIGSRCGIPVPVFRMFYLIWSTQAHGLPMSYHRMAADKRGAGVHCFVEESYTAMCLNLCAQLLVDSTAEMHELFRDFPAAQNPRPPVPGLLGKMLARAGQ